MLRNGLWDRLLAIWLGLLLALALPAVAPAQTTGLTLTPEPETPAESDGEANFPAPTAGGMQFWSDVVCFRDWRIQQHAATGHCRLLDGSNVRRAWGTLSECEAALAAARREEHLPPMQGRAVIVIHGLIRTRRSMDTLADHLRAAGDCAVFNLSYPSGRLEIDRHARNLASVLEHLEGITSIDFVAHSMGNIVVRRYLARQAADGKPVDPRIRRMVMLGPPNHGSEVATALAGSSLFGVVFGPSGQQLGRQWDEFEEKLATPPFAFGIVAGGLSDDKGFNPLLPGDDDGLVTVESTRLAGAGDSIVVPVLHGLLMEDDQVLAYTRRFLDEGYFVAPGQRRPIPAASAGEP